MYATYSTTAFAIPSHLGACQSAALDNPKFWAKVEVEHESQVKEYEKYAKVIDGLKMIIQQKV